jgi:beta-glucosidase
LDSKHKELLSLPSIRLSRHQHHTRALFTFYLYHRETHNDMPTITDFPSGVQAVIEGQSSETVAEALLSQLTPEERLWLLDGDEPFWSGFMEMLTVGYNTKPYIHGQIDRISLPGLRFSDGPRGIVMGKSTPFPVSMARAATWDTSLEEKVGRAIGLEARAQGANFFGGVCINLVRHPAWGRAQESYGEDPIILGEFGSALSRGVQRNAIAVAKHYALNSMENARFTVDVTASEAVLQEVYLPHFRQVIEEGCLGIMSAYNSVNGEWAGQNGKLLENTLRHQFDFKGVVVSDFIWGLRDAALSLKAGLDVEEPLVQQRAQHLAEALKHGDVVTQYHVDRSAKRIIATQLVHYANRDKAEPSMDVVFCKEHQDLAREVSARSMVLLKNELVKHEPILPLRRAELRNVAMIGRLANVANTGDNGSSALRNSPYVVTPFEGLKSSLPNASVILEEKDDSEAAAQAAYKADVAIIIVGYTAADEGEYLDPAAMGDPALTGLFPPPDGSDAANAVLSTMGGGGDVTSLIGSAEGFGGDRKALRIRPVDVEIIKAVSAVNPRTVVCIVTAGAVITEEWRSLVPGVVVSWYSGAEGGNALADVLLGDVDASGRLPYSISTTEDHLPFLDINAKTITYDRWHGQRLLDRLGVPAAFPLGFGLSYTSFHLADLTVKHSSISERLEITIMVKNTGTREGRHVVQVYGKPQREDKEFPTRLLLGFASVTLLAKETKVVRILASARPLKMWIDGKFEWASKEAKIEVGAYSGDESALTRLVALV